MRPRISNSVYAGSSPAVGVRQEASEAGGSPFVSGVHRPLGFNGEMAEWFKGGGLENRRA